MKYLVFVCALWQIVQCNVLPDYLQQFACRKSDPEYERCVLEGFEKVRPYFVKGIPELNVPSIDPFELPIMTVNRTINDIVSINAVCTNIKVLGGSNSVIQSLKADPIKHTGEIRFYSPWLYLDMDYDVTGQLLVVPLRSAGHFTGNFTDTYAYIKGGLKTYKKNGVDYFKVHKINAKITIGDGRVKLTSNEKDMQFGTDLITTLFNENPRRVLDAVNPIFIESSNDLFRQVADQILSTLPASEWLPA